VCFSRMRHFFIVASVLLACACGYSADPFEVPGALSDKLGLMLAFEPKSGTATDHFIIALTNRSGQALWVVVNPTEFHGSIFVKPEGKEQTEYFETNYFMMMMTSAWVEPAQQMEKGATIVWKVPLAALWALGKSRLTVPDLAGATAYAEMDKLAIRPPKSAQKRFWIDGNASQASERIRIKLGPAALPTGRKPGYLATNQVEPAMAQDLSATTNSQKR